MDHYSSRLLGAWVSLFPDGQVMQVGRQPAAGVPARALSALVDQNADRSVAAERALDAERERRENSVATLAHELRQPLSVLQAAVEVAGLAPGTPAANRAAEIMKRQLSRMDRVVEDIMDEARWARGKVTLRKERIDVRDTVRNAALDVSAAVAERGHELVVATSPDPLWAHADPQRLQQVFSNLLSNAVKYTDPGGRIWLEADREASSVTMRVSDTGRGIEPEALNHIFDLFTQVRPSESGGLGVGLSVVREIVSLHEGQIEARSDGPGQGSEFIVTLPLASPPQSVAIS